MWLEPTEDTPTQGSPAAQLPARSGDKDVESKSPLWTLHAQGPSPCTGGVSHTTGLCRRGAPGTAPAQSTQVCPLGEAGAYGGQLPHTPPGHCPAGCSPGLASRPVGVPAAGGTCPPCSPDGLALSSGLTLRALSPRDSSSSTPPPSPRPATGSGWAHPSLDPKEAERGEKGEQVATPEGPRDTSALKGTCFRGALEHGGPQSLPGLAVPAASATPREGRLLARGRRRPARESRRTADMALWLPCLREINGRVIRWLA